MAICAGVAGGLGALEGLAVHLIEVGENAISGAGHAGLVDGSRSEAGRLVDGLVAPAIERVEQVPSAAPIMRRRELRGSVIEA